MPNGINNNGIGTHEYLPRKCAAHYETRFYQILDIISKIRPFVGVGDAVWVSCVLFFSHKKPQRKSLFEKKNAWQGRRIFNEISRFFIFWTKQKIISVCFGVTWVILVSKNDDITGKHADKNGLRLPAMASISITLSLNHMHYKIKWIHRERAKKNNHWNMQTEYK